MGLIAFVLALAGLGILYVVATYVLVYAQVAWASFKTAMVASWDAAEKADAEGRSVREGMKAGVTAAFEQGPAAGQARAREIIEEVRRG